MNFQYQPGHQVVFAGSLYTVMLTIVLTAPPYPQWQPGAYYALRLPQWPLCHFLIVPATELEPKGELAA